MESFILGLSIAVGCLQCFFGYRTFKTVLLSTGFLLGFGAGSMGFGAPHYSGFHSLIGGIVGGLLGAILMSALYLVGLFILGASLGWIIGMSLFPLFQSPPHPAILGILALLLGVATVKAQKFMIIFATAFEGAWLIVMGIALFLQPDFFSPGPYYLFYPGNFRNHFPIMALFRNRRFYVSVQESLSPGKIQINQIQSITESPGEYIECEGWCVNDRKVLQ